MYTRILVPLDGSDFAEFAIPAALSVAGMFDASVELVSVVTPILPPPFVEHMTKIEAERNEEAERHAREYLQDILKRTTEAAGSDVGLSTSLLIGPTTETLAEHARSTGVNLIVMTTHGRGPLMRAWLGSIADGLLRRSPCALMLVRPTDDEKADLAASVRFEHILVPLDGSEVARDILTDATQLGRASGAYLSLVKVLLPSFPVGSPYLPHLIEEEREHAEAAEAAKTYLDGIVAGLSDEGIDADGTVLTDSRPAEAILAFAERHGVDLITMTTHGRGRVPRMVLGSVADKVVRGAEVPVLTRRAEES